MFIPESGTAGLQAGVPVWYTSAGCRPGPAETDRGVNGMPWYWILIIISAVVGPFEAMHALNKARRNREKARKRTAEAARGNGSGQD